MKLGTSDHWQGPKHYISLHGFIRVQLEGITHHLQKSYIFLPPDVLLVPGPHICYEVIAIHDYMYVAVNVAYKAAVSTWLKENETWNIAC